jgi:hypothetical protein
MEFSRPEVAQILIDAMAEQHREDVDPRALASPGNGEK